MSDRRLRAPALIRQAPPGSAPLDAPIPTTSSYRARAGASAPLVRDKEAASRSTEASWPTNGWVGRMRGWGLSAVTRKMV